MEEVGTREGIERSQALLERLNRYPVLRRRMEEVLAVVENASGDVVKADEAEERVLQEIRQMGQEALQAWAERKQRRLEVEYDGRAEVCRKEKKSCGGTHDLER
jgi:hypothetical protein